MADQVSLMASGGLSSLSSLSHEIADEFSGVWTRSACGLEYEGDEVNAWISIKFGFLSSLGHESWFCAGCSDEGRVAGEGSNNGDIQMCGRTIEVEDEIHARILTLTVHNTSKSRYILFNEYLGAAVYVCETSRHCCVPAVDTSSEPTYIAMVLLRVRWFVADQAAALFVGAGLYKRLWRWGAPGAGASTSWLLRKQRSSASYASLLGCMRCAPVCEVDCDGRMARSPGMSARLL